MSPGKVHETRVSQSRGPLVAECNFRMFVPDGVPIVRCIFAINMRGAGKHLFDRDGQWRAMAARTRAAMMYCEFEATGVRDNGYGLSMLTACDHFAAELERAELKHAPFILWGHSMGGRVAQDFARLRPSRVLAFHIALRALESSEEFMAEEPAPMRIPALYLMGERDEKPADIRAHFVRARTAGSPRAWIWLPRQGHWPRGMGFESDETTAKDWESWVANEVVIPWTRAIIELRLPDNADPRSGPVKLLEPRIEQGWLGDIQTGTIAPYDAFRKNKSQASWFPSGEVAAAWAKYCFLKERQTECNSP